jgi:hypothetical protein
VDHGEFEAVVAMTMEHANKGDTSGFSRPEALVLQRCRRAGKTFMLHAVASRLLTRVDNETHVISITMNSDSHYQASTDDAYQAILRQIAYEYTGCSNGDIMSSSSQSWFSCSL